MIAAAKIRPRKCKTCRAPFTPRSGFQKVCGPICAISYSRSQRAKELRAEKIAGRARLMTRRDWIKKAQVAVNRYVRLRDAGKGCISCGNLPQQKVGGTMDAGHYRGTGSAPHLRFFTLQIAAQCVECNRYRGGMPIEFRRGLIQRYGIQVVERVECMQGPAKYSASYLERLARIFTRRARRMEKRLNEFR